MKVKKQSTKTKQEEKDVGVLDRIRPMGFEEAEGFSINIYGRSGTGKTTLWGTFPKPILALLCSGGDRTGELRSLDTAANRKRIKYVVIEEPEELKEVIQYQHEEEEFATIVLDHVSDFQNLVLRKILGTDVLPEQKSWGMATREQYGKCTLQMKEYLREFLNLECNRVIVAQERVFEPDEASRNSNLVETFIASALTPSVVGWLNPACDYVCQTFIRPKSVTKKIGKDTKVTKESDTDFEWCLRTRVDALHEIKFRTSNKEALPVAIANPTYDKICSMMQGG